METSNYYKLLQFLSTMIVVGILTFVFILDYSKEDEQQKVYEKNIEKLNSLLLTEIDSLRNEISLQDSLLVLKNKEIESLEFSINKIRSEKDEKINIVNNLSFDKSFEYLSKFLSKEVDY